MPDEKVTLEARRIESPEDLCDCRFVERQADHDQSAEIVACEQVLHLHQLVQDLGLVSPIVNQ